MGRMPILIDLEYMFSSFRVPGSRREAALVGFLTAPVSKRIRRTPRTNMQPAITTNCSIGTLWCTGSSPILFPLGAQTTHEGGGNTTHADVSSICTLPGQDSIRGEPAGEYDRPVR